MSKKTFDYSCSEGNKHQHRAHLPTIASRTVFSNSSTYPRDSVVSRTAAACSSSPTGAHHWKIGSVMAGRSVGVCLHCGSRKDFAFDLDSLHEVSRPITLEGEAV